MSGPVQSGVTNPIIGGAAADYGGLPPKFKKTVDDAADLANATPAHAGDWGALNNQAGGIDNRTSQSTKYPAKYLRKVPEEDALSELQQAIATYANGPDAPFLKPELPQAAVTLQRKKQRQAFEIAVAKWIEENYDLTNPVNVKYTMELFPEYWAKMRETIDEAGDLLKKYALFNKMGGYIDPGDEDMKEFAIASAFGLIDIDAGILKYFMPTQADWDVDKTNAIVQRGLFSPVKPASGFRNGIRGGIANMLNSTDTPRPVIQTKPNLGGGVFGNPAFSGTNSNLNVDALKAIPSAYGPVKRFGARPRNPAFLGAIADY